MRKKEELEFFWGFVSLIWILIGIPVSYGLDLLAYHNSFSQSTFVMAITGLAVFLTAFVVDKALAARSRTKAGSSRKRA